MLKLFSLGKTFHIFKEKGNEVLKAEARRYKEILEAKLAELAQALRNRDGIAISKSADAVDEVQNAAERELAIRNLDRESVLLRDVRSALQRIDEGGYGVCLGCEENISPKRLKALPWAALCIQCQEIADKRRDAGESFELAADVA